MRNAVRINEQVLQTKSVYTPVSQSTLENPRGSQTSPRSGQKEEINCKETGSQMHRDSNPSETMSFRSRLGAALQSPSYGSQTDQAYQNYPTHSRENITNGQAEGHNQIPTQSNSADGIPESMAATALDCNGLPPLSPALDGEFLDLSFSSQEHVYMDLEPQHSNSTSSSSEDKCYCLSYIIQSLNKNRQENHARRDPMNRIHSLNGAAEQFLLCDSNHSKLWYIILLALYQDADDCLGSTEESQEMTGVQSEAKESYSDTNSSLNMDPKKRNIILKTFILLSSTVSALPFKFGADTDDKFSCEMMDTFAGLVRDRFENRLL
ncbi:hypothetical protein BM1_00751 [Bipolaris maydis]|nr:hypothetical protein BM1_00751 [Bipolaris maydis]